MRKSFTLIVVTMLVVALAAPAVVLAGGKGSGGKKPAARSAPKQVRVKPQVAAKAAKREMKGVRKQLRMTSLESSPTSPSTEATKSVGPGVANALSHIIANITRKLAKFGEDFRLSFGLLSVWTKFSTWLGQPTDVRPWETSPTVPGSGITSPPAGPSVITTPPAL